MPSKSRIKNDWAIGRRTVTSKRQWTGVVETTRRATITHQHYIFPGQPSKSKGTTVQLYLVAKDNILSSLQSAVVSRSTTVILLINHMYISIHDKAKVQEVNSRQVICQCPAFHTIGAWKRITTPVLQFFATVSFQPVNLHSQYAHSERWTLPRKVASISDL